MHKKAIEEMAKVLYGHYCGEDKCGSCKMPNCANYHRAELLVKADYRKADEVRKETAKEIYNEFKGFLRDDEVALLAWLQAIVSKFGVEIEK